MTEKPSVCCLIISYAPSKEVLEECIDSLVSQTCKPDRIFIADNFSTKSFVVEFLQRDDVDILMLPRNYGFAGAINQTIWEIEEDYVLIMNFDIILDSSFIEEALKGFADDDVLCVTGKTLFFMDRKVIDNTGTLVNGLMSAYNRGIGQIDIGQYDTPDRPMGACFAAALIKKTAFDKKYVGPMDSSYFLYYEDVDWCYRLNIYGYKVAYTPLAVAYHHHSLTMRGKGLMFKYYYIQRNLLYTIIKNMRLRTAIKLIGMHFIYHTRRARVEKKFWKVTAKIYASLLFAFPRLCFQRIRIQRRRKVSDTDVINLSIGERSHLDDVLLIPRVTWDNLLDTYSRLARSRGDEITSGMVDILKAAIEAEAINEGTADQIREIFKDEDERIQKMVRKLLDEHRGESS